MHATAMSVLMSAMVKMPLARARSPNPRTADQYIFLHLAPQKRCGEPPRRARNGRSHQRHKVGNSSLTTRSFQSAGSFKRSQLFLQTHIETRMGVNKGPVTRQKGDLSGFVLTAEER